MKRQFLENGIYTTFAHLQCISSLQRTFEWSVETNKRVMSIINKWSCHILQWRRSPKAFENKATGVWGQTRSSHSNTLHFTQHSHLRFVCPFTTFSRSMPNRTRFGFRFMCTSGSLFSPSASISFSNVELFTSSNLHPIFSL